MQTFANHTKPQIAATQIQFCQQYLPDDGNKCFAGRSDTYPSPATSQMLLVLKQSREL